LDRLTSGEKLLGVSALGLYIFSFIPFWAKLEFEAPGTRSMDRVSAWDGYGLGVKLALILAPVAVGLVAARAAGPRFHLPVSAWGLVYAGIGGLTLALMLFTALIGPDAPAWASTLPSGAHVEISRGPGLFIGTLLAGTMAVGGYQHMQPEDAATAPHTTAPTASPPTTPTGA
jgi:hypothetical protein